MAKYIDFDALGIGKCNPDVFEDKGYAAGWNSAIEIMQNAPTVDVWPVVHSSWHDCYQLLIPDCYVATCKACGKEHKYLGGALLEYCPHCGAKML